MPDIDLKIFEKSVCVRQLKIDDFESVPRSNRNAFPGIVAFTYVVAIFSMLVQ